MNLTLVTDRRLCGPDRLLARVEEALRGGVTTVQLREKDLGGLALRELATSLRTLCHRFGARLLVNDRLDVAVAVDADGVHLPAASFRVSEARAALGPHRLIGVSTHSAEEIQAAARDGADFAVFGPVFATASKSAFGEPQGVERLRQACATAKIPVIAIGGIGAAQVPLVRGAGAAGVAVISAILAAEDSYAAAREISVAEPDGNP